jgi:hypothetical protein
LANNRRPNSANTITTVWEPPGVVGQRRQEGRERRVELGQQGLLGLQLGGMGVEAAEVDRDVAGGVGQDQVRHDVQLDRQHVRAREAAAVGDGQRALAPSGRAARRRARR